MLRILRDAVMDKVAANRQIPNKIKNILAKVKNIGLSGGISTEHERMVGGSYYPLGGVVEQETARYGRTPYEQISALKAHRASLVDKLNQASSPEEVFKELSLSRGTPTGITLHPDMIRGKGSAGPEIAYHELTHLGQDLVDPGIIIRDIENFGSRDAAVRAFYNTNPREIGARFGASKRLHGLKDPHRLALDILWPASRADLPDLGREALKTPMPMKFRRFLEEYIAALTEGMPK